MWERNPMKGARGGAIGLQVSNDVAFSKRLMFGFSCEIECGIWQIICK